MNKEQEKGDATHEPKTLTTIWDCDKIQKIFHDESNKFKPQWKCSWCNKKFQCHNASRALAHVTGGEELCKRKHVKACDNINTIGETYKLQYKLLLNEMQIKQESKCNTDLELLERSYEGIEESCTKTSTTKRQKGGRTRYCCQHCPPDLSSQSLILINDDDNEDPSTKKTRTMQLSLVPSGGQLTMHQTMMEGGPKGQLYVPSAETKLDYAIAQFIVNDGLQFSICESPNLKACISYAKNVRSSYKPPTRNTISNRFLDELYQKYKENGIRELQRDASIYGLSLAGDGATCHKKPLFNAMMAGIHLSTYIAGVEDCSEPLSKGIDKTGEFLKINIYQKWMKLMLAESCLM